MPGHNRYFLLLWSGQAVASLGGAVAAVAFPFLAIVTTGSATGAGAVAFAGLATGAVLRLPGGVLADRWPLRALIVSAEAVRAVVTGTLVLAVLLGALTLTHLVAAAVVAAACGACVEPAQTVAVRHVVAADRLPQALARNEARSHVAALGGQPLGGWLYGVGAAVPLAAHALSYVVSAVTVGLVRTRMGGDHRPPASLRAEIATGLRHLWRSPFLRATLLLAAAFQVVFAGLGLVIVAAAVTGRVPAVHVGAALAVAGVGGLAGAAAAGWIQRRVSPAGLVTAFGWTTTGCLALMAVLPDIFVVGALLGVVYLVATPTNAMLVAAQMRITPPHLQGRVISAAMLVAGCAAPLGPLAGGALLDGAGRTATFVVLAGAALVVTVAAHASRELRDLTPWPPAGDGGGARD